MAPSATAKPVRLRSEGREELQMCTVLDPVRAQVSKKEREEGGCWYQNIFFLNARCTIGMPVWRRPSRFKTNTQQVTSEKRQNSIVPDPTARGSSHIEAVDAPTPKLTPLEKLVRFDLDWNFGPCTGISRMERWQRAQTLDLMPPQDIKQILLAHSSDPQYQHNLWSTYAI